MIVTFKGREVDIELENATPDYDYWCDVFVDKAVWQDTDTELTGDEYDEINEELKKDDQWILDWIY